MKPLCIVQARMNSTRLPGKVMLEVKGKPLLGYLLERLAYCNVKKVCLAIPIEDVDSPLGGIAAYTVCGPQHDVAERFRVALDGEGCDTFIRICADSPLLDPALVDAAVALYEPPYLQIHSPVGCVEVCDTAVFLASLPFLDTHGREHVTGAMKTRDIIEIGTTWPRLVVDTAEDFERVAAVIEKMDRPHTEYGWRECLALL